MILIENALPPPIYDLLLAYLTAPGAFIAGDLTTSVARATGGGGAIGLERGFALAHRTGALAVVTSRTSDNGAAARHNHLAIQD